MNISVDRNNGEQVRLTLWLDPDEARRVMESLREVLGDTKPPTPRPIWKPLVPPPDLAPLPSAAVRAEIQAKIGKPSPPRRMPDVGLRSEEP